MWNIHKVVTSKSGFFLFLNWYIVDLKENYILKIQKYILPYIFYFSKTLATCTIGLTFIKKNERKGLSLIPFVLLLINVFEITNDTVLNFHRRQIWISFG